MGVLLQVIFWIIIIYYCLRFVSRFLLIFFVKRWSKKMQENMHKKSNNNYTEHKDGETVVQYKKTSKSKSDPGGEYVDFEDVNDDS